MARPAPPSDTGTLPASQRETPFPRSSPAPPTSPPPLPSPASDSHRSPPFDFLFLGPPRKWHHTACVLRVWLISRSIMSLSFVHVVVRVTVLFPFTAGWRPVACTHPPVSVHLSVAKSCLLVVGGVGHFFTCSLATRVASVGKGGASPLPPLTRLFILCCGAVHGKGSWITDQATVVTVTFLVCK